MTYRECYDQGRDCLAQTQIAEAELDARLLLEFVCGTDRGTLLAHGDRPVSGEEQKRYEELIQKRSQHIPLQHLTGEQNFMGLDFIVNEHVLVPRQDTEILVEEVLKYLHDGMRILDLCTGSGCILISLLHYSNGCEGTGVDISDEALEVARRNAEKLLYSEGDTAVEACRQVHMIQGDLYENVAGKYEMIVSNPPYIRRDVIPGLMPEVREHEPYIALDGGDDGLDFYRRIIAGAPAHLCGGGMLFLEIGYDQSKDVTKLMKAAGFAEVRVVKDYAGLDRVVCGIKF